MTNETKKILDQNIELSATCVESSGNGISF